MAAPFRVFDSALPDPDCGNLKATIERNYTKLESLFTQLQASEKRLKPLPRMPLPTLSAPYELAAIQALRALGLVEAGALLIEEANWGAVFPVLRALFEVWIALTYAEIMFRRLAIDKSRWNKYDAISTRLIQGRTANFPNDTESEDESRIIYIGTCSMRSSVFGGMVRQRLLRPCTITMRSSPTTRTPPSGRLPSTWKSDPMVSALFYTGAHCPVG